MRWSQGSSAVLGGSGVEDLEDETEVVAMRRDVADQVYSRIVTVSDGPEGRPFWTMGFDFFFFPDAGMIVLGKERVPSHVRYVPTYTYLHVGRMHSILHNTMPDAD